MVNHLSFLKIPFKFLVFCVDLRSQMARKQQLLEEAKQDLAKMSEYEVRDF